MMNAIEQRAAARRQRQQQQAAAVVAGDAEVGGHNSDVDPMQPPEGQGAVPAPVAPDIGRSRYVA
jgi:hypothetical protein